MNTASIVRSLMNDVKSVFNFWAHNKCGRPHNDYERPVRAHSFGKRSESETAIALYVRIASSMVMLYPSSIS